MKKLSFLFVFASFFFLTNVCWAQDNTSIQQKSNEFTARLKNVSKNQVAIADITDKQLVTNAKGYKIASFDVSLHIDGKLYTISTVGDRLSERQATLVRKQKPGDIVSIENIKCTNTEGNEKVLPSLVLSIKTDTKK